MHLDQETKQSHPSFERVCLGVIATAVVTYMIFWLRPVLVPFVVALFVVSGVSPILEMLEKRLGVNRLIAAAITFLSGLTGILILGLSFWLSIVEIADQGAAYRQRVTELLANAQGRIESTFARKPLSFTNQVSEQSVADEQSASGSPPNQLANGRAESDSVENDTLQKLSLLIDRFLRTGLTRLSAELFSLVTTSIVVLIYVFFLLLATVDMQGSRISVQQIDFQVRKYLALKTVISLVTGGLFGLTLWLFGVPMALTFGVLAFLLNYIPNIGPLGATLLPIPFIVLHPEGSLSWMIAAIATTSTIQVISGNIVEPKVMGESSDLHPVVILLALMFWGMMWGITGMFLATPITAGIKIAFESFDSTRPIAGMLAGRWAKA